MAEHAVEKKVAIIIGVGETIGRGIEFGVMLLTVEVERIEIGDQMTAHPIGADQHQNSQTVAGARQHVLGAQARGIRHAGQGRRLAVEIIEDVAPVEFDRRRIGTVAFVEFLDEAKIGPAEERQVVEPCRHFPPHPVGPAVAGINTVAQGVGIA